MTYNLNIYILYEAMIISKFISSLPFEVWWEFSFSRVLNWECISGYPLGNESIMEEENHRAPATFKGDMLVPWRVANKNKSQKMVG